MRKANLQTLVSVAEIVSALALVASLLYVASEFRRSRTLTSTDVQSTLYGRMLEIDRLVIENADLAEILARVGAGDDDLTPPELQRYLAFEHVFYDTWELAWTSYQEGVLKEEAWQDWGGWFVEEARRRSLLGWRGNRKNHGAEFARFVDAQIDSG